MIFKAARTQALALAATALAISTSACTGHAPDSFRLMPQTEAFQVGQEVNTKVDILWVVDNSASMDVSQDRLRKGFTSFAAKYLKPNWDIRMGVITTDTYLADPAFTSFLNTTLSNTTGWASPYINSRLSTFVNPAYNPNLVNLSTGRFQSGVRWKDMVPAWGPNYAKLLPGIHDGPIAALCSEIHPYFFNGLTQCRIRDDQTRYRGAEGCLNPAGDETSITQCVNTVQNDSVRSGKPIVSTMPPAEVAGDEVWAQSVARDFMVNASVGSSGSGSERGLSSVLQLLKDNEPTSSSLFRKGSIRVIVFLADEDDQSQVVPTSVPAGFGPFYAYSQSCEPKTVDGYTYTLSSCPRKDLLLPVADVKTKVDTFFRGIDGSGPDASANYFVVSIVPTSGDAIQKLQQERVASDNAAGNSGNIAVDRGDRYMQFGELVGNGSMALNIADEDYSPMLDTIGRAIVQKKSTFNLERAPTSAEEVIITIVHDKGGSTVIPRDKYTVSGNSVIINDLDFVLSLSSQDKIVINYEPKTLY